MLEHEMPLHFVNTVYAHSSRNKHPSFPQTGSDHFVSAMEFFFLESGTKLLNVIWLIPSFEMLNTFSDMTKVLVAIKIEK
jgi:hypothetical protein